MLLHHEPHEEKSGVKSNWLRAAILGANDGIVSVASIVLGVSGASYSSGFILTAGIAGLTAGALSMAVGEYVSVSTQRDTEKAMLEKEHLELLNQPKAEVDELALMYEKKGLSSATARAVAEELCAHDAPMAHAEMLHIDPNHLSNPWHAAYASAAAFVSGAVIPLFAITLPPADLRIPVTFVGVLLALVITGALSAQAGGVGQMKTIVRVVIGGVIAMAVTYGIGRIFGVVGI
jgi:VIT1/CCC1 family predicted Fe2+/Mn2+ transporter